VVAKVEYSFDGGKNWLPVDKLVTAGQAKVSFNFTAPPLDDGNYSVIARATDGGGNQSDTAPQTVVIDRLPPVVGGTVLSSGTQILSPNSDGTLTIAAESSVTFTANAAGGPTQITLVAWPTDTTQSPESFRLRRSADTGLWSGNLALGRPGHYSLIAKAKDGAGSTTERTVGQLLVASPGHIIDARTKLPVTATVTLHYRDPCTNRWTLWDGSAYGQANPVVTAADGSFGLRAQAGMYYAQVSAPGYQTVVTRSFTVDRSQVISATISLQREPGFKLGPWTLRLPWFSFSQTPIDVSTNRSAATSRALPQLPNISLPLVAGGQLKMVDLLGHPTILTIVSTWAQPARDQLAILDQLPHLDANVVAVGSGQSLAKLATYEQISGYQVRLVADVDSQFMASLGASTLPTTYFIDRHGVVKKVMVGVLSKQELFNNVTTN
jgi:peroxiredoxin